MASEASADAVRDWMGEVDPSQLGFPFELDRSRYAKQTGVAYKQTPAGALHLDLYRPTGASRPPLCVMIHGGGWSGGGRFEMGLSKWAGYLASAGMLVASIDYRLAPQTCFPDSFQDCLDAVDWVADRAEELGADPERIGLWGDSAGGHLVLLLATSQTHPGYAGPRMATPAAQLRAVVAWYPPTDVLELHRLATAAGSASGLRDFVGADPEDEPERWRLASPMEHVHPAAPPTLILQGTHDFLVPHSQATSYAERAGAHGAPCELHVVEGAVHGFDRVAPGDEARRLIERTRTFLQERLGL